MKCKELKRGDIIKVIINNKYPPITVKVSESICDFDHQRKLITLYNDNVGIIVCITNDDTEIDDLRKVEAYVIDTEIFNRFKSILQVLLSVLEIKFRLK